MDRFIGKTADSRYSRLLCLIIQTAAVYFFLTALKAEKTPKSVGWLSVCVLLTAIGYSIKGSLGVLAVFGFGLFFVLWEIKPRYLLNVLPLMIIIAADGVGCLNAFLHRAAGRLKPKKQQAKAS